MKIIVDMMGGDNAPLAVLEGAAAAVKEYGVSLIGVGNEELVRKTAGETAEDYRDFAAENGHGKIYDLTAEGVKEADV